MNKFGISFKITEKIAYDDNSPIINRATLFSPKNEEIYIIFNSYLSNVLSVDEEDLKSLVIYHYFDFDKLITNFLKTNSLTIGTVTLYKDDFINEFNEWYMESEYYTDKENKYDFYNIAEDETRIIKG